MDAKRNPYAPGAGTPPPILAGRDDLVAKADLVLARARDGRAAKSFIAVGLRGVGKTVVLNKVRDLADGQGYLRWPHSFGQLGGLAKLNPGLIVTPPAFPYRGPGSGCTS